MTSIQVANCSGHRGTANRLRPVASARVSESTRKPGRCQRRSPACSRADTARVGLCRRCMAQPVSSARLYRLSVVSDVSMRHSSAVSVSTETVSNSFCDSRLSCSVPSTVIASRHGFCNELLLIVGRSSYQPRVRPSLTMPLVPIAAQSLSLERCTPWPLCCTLPRALPVQRCFHAQCTQP